MIVEQIYTSCLSQASYYIQSNGEAVIIDPIRDYEVYLNLARQHDARIRYIFETHFHADFVSGHLDLAKATNATIVYGPGAECGFECHIAKDGEKIRIGDVTLEVLHTPGHTPESVCYLLYDTHGHPNAVFTGDTLFVGDVGRPDLCQAGADMTTESMAGMLYDSLYSKILTLPDEILVYPGHGPGSACGKSLGPEKASTIGREKENNYALQPMKREEFIATVTEGIGAPPAYFFDDAALNKKGYPLVDDILKDARPLSVDEFKKEMADGALVIDSRHPDVFENGFIPGSVNIGLNGQYAIWAANLFDLDRRILIVAASGSERESMIRLTRVGFGNISGYLDGGFDAWKSAGYNTDLIVSIDAEEFALDQNYGQNLVLDVRKPGEWSGGVVENAALITLEELQERLHHLDKDADMDIHCAGGYRSMIAASILKANGFHRLRNVYGGFGKIKDTQVKIQIPENATA